jgi:hypothetical protein
MKHLKTTRNMKNLRLLATFMSVAAVVSLIVVGACTKEGPQGPAGEDGIDGKDGNATCGVCHDNSETVETKIGQWETSFHATSGLQFENAAGCAPCHTSQGFKEALANDTTACTAAIPDPANINCYTCHKIHDTYAVDDWELRKTDPNTFWLTGETVDLGKANLCIRCHQPRISYQIPDVTNPEGTYSVTSTRFGPHHGPQGTTLNGIAFYKVGEGYMNSAHTNIEDGCVTCHMADATGYANGGHTFRVEDEEEGLNTKGCLECHTAAEAEDAKDALQAEVLGLLDQLGVKLEAAGIYNPAGTSGYAVKGDYTNKVAGAYWNFISIMEDKSEGVHNPKFVRTLLQNSINSLP